VLNVAFLTSIMLLLPNEPNFQCTAEKCEIHVLFYMIFMNDLVPGFTGTTGTFGRPRRSAPLMMKVCVHGAEANKIRANEESQFRLSQIGDLIYRYHKTVAFFSKKEETERGTD
jgi:hypothetical protein